MELLFVVFGERENCFNLMQLVYFCESYLTEC